MNYITKERMGKEQLIAVTGSDENANHIVAGLNLDPMGFAHGKSYVRGLTYLLEHKLEIPPELQWIVESDRKHQEREIKGRIGNLCDDQALSHR